MILNIIFYTFYSFIIEVCEYVTHYSIIHLYIVKVKVKVEA